MKNLTIKLRIIIGFTLVVSLLMLVSISSLTALKDIERAMSVVTEETTPIVVVGGQMMSTVLEANRAVVQHVGAQSEDKLSSLESRFDGLMQQAAEQHSALQEMSSHSAALGEHTQALLTPYERFAELGPAIFQTHHEAIELKKRVDTLADDFEDTASELLLTIDSQLDDAQGELEAVRALYQLRELINKDTRLVMKAHARHDLAALERFSQTLPAQVGKMGEALSLLEDDGSVDNFDLQELADVVDSYKAALIEPNRFFALQTEQLRKEAAYTRMLTEMNQAADAVSAALKSTVQQGEAFTDEAESGAAKTFSLSRALLIGVSVVAVLVALGVGFWLMRAIQIPLARVISVLRVMAQGYLRTKLDDGTRNEFGELSRNVNSLVDQLSNAIRDITDSSKTLNKAAETTKSLSDQTKSQVEEQRSQTDQAAAAMTEMSSTVAEIARNTDLTLTEVTRTNEGAQKGNGTVKQAVNATEHLSKQIGDASEMVSSLEQSVESISHILDVIKNIAEQTNLLALNAAIEAARAGEQGRGFAVVSDEVRTLAGRTQQSTREIEEMITGVQEGARRAVASMGESVNDASKTVKYVEAAGQAFDGIVESMKTIFDMCSQSASAVEQQSATTEEIAKNVNCIAAIAEHTAGSAVEASQRSDGLADLARRLQSQVSHFTIADGIEQKN